MSWHILTVAPQHEFRVRDELHDLGWSALVPVEFRFRKVKRNTKPLPVRSPRVPGYVFADVETWHSLRSVPNWWGIIHSDGRPFRLNDLQISAIEALSVSAAAIPGRWQPGQRIRIKRGALTQLEGIIEVIRRGKPIAAVEMFGKTHRIPVDPEIIERVPYP